MKSTVIFPLLLVVVQSAKNYTICDAYSELEASAPCGAKGYALNFGLPICKKFVDNEWMFNSAGKVFLNCVRPCLANFVSANITTRIANCNDINNDAFASHVPCYNKCNFCSVILSNSLPFWRTFKISNFLSKNAIKQVAKVAAGCVRDSIGR